MRSYWILCAVPLLSSCLAMGGGNRVDYDEEHRLPVKFESEAASADFWRGHEIASRDDYTDAGGFGVLFLVGAGGQVFHETQYFNAQVRRADVDGDGLVVDSEARAYRLAMEADKDD